MSATPSDVSGPAIRGVTFEDKPGMDTACSDTLPCAAGQRCGSLGLCIPVVPHCNERKVDDCPTYSVKAALDQSIVEKDLTSPPVDGVQQILLRYLGPV